MITFPELSQILLLALNLQIDLPKEYRTIKKPNNLTAQAAKKVRESIKPLTDENLKNLNQIPEELYNLLGLIQIPKTADQEKINKQIDQSQDNLTAKLLSSDSSLISIQNFDYLDVDSIEYFSKRTFKDLIKEKRRQTLPFILAITTCQKDGKCIKNCYDAIGLNSYIISKNHNNLTQESTLKDPQTLSEITQIKYFIIWHPSLQAQAAFLGTEEELMNGHKKEHMTKLFSACFGNYDSQEFIKKLRWELGLENNNQIAQYCFGYTLPDIEQAKKYLILSADQNFAPAHFALAKIYEHEKKKREKFEHLEKAADLGLATAQALLGEHYSSNLPDIKRAKHYLMLAYKQGNVEAARDLGDIFQREYSITNDEESKRKAKELFNFAAKDGDSYSQLELANLLEDEEPERIKYLTLAADQDDLDAKYELWQIYEEKKDFKNAQFWVSNIIKELTEAVTSYRSIEPLRQLINIYVHINQKQEALRCGNLLLQKLTEMTNNGDVTAKCELVALHKTMAKLQFESLKNDAENGDPVAQVYMGDYCTRKNNEPEAKKYYKLASKQKNVSATIKLAYIYKKKNKIVKARDCFKIVSQNGDLDQQLEAQKALKKLDKQT